MKTRILFVTLISLFLATLTSCVKEEFDKPPVGSIPVGEILTIADVRQMYADSGEFVFKDDYSLYATVTMDDASGNIYKSAYIQDPTGAVNLYMQEPGGVRAGDSIRVYLKNCEISDYSELLQIANVQNDSNIIILANQHYMQPELVSIPDILGGGYEAKLVRLENVEFAENELGKNWANADESANRLLEDCDLNTLFVRTSSYAYFADQKIPEGKGSLIAIVGRYYDDWQLYIRSTDEVDLTGERCEGGGGGGPVEPVDEIHEYFDDAVNYQDIEFEGWENIIVSGDRKWQGKEYNSNMYAQATGYNSGLSEMETWLITPPVKTSGNVLTFVSAKAYWAHTSGEGFAVMASSDYDGENLQSATWVELDARLAAETDPDNEWIESGEVDISQFTDYCFIAFRYKGSETESTSFRVDDVVVAPPGGSGGGGITSIDEAFDGQENYTDIEIDGWLNTPLMGTRAWQGKEYSGNLYAQATSYNSGEENVCWLITPEIDLDAMSNPRFECETAQAYWVHDGLSIMISTDFDGTNVESATWTDLGAVVAGQNDPDHAWISSGVISLDAYSGSAWIGFRYEGIDPDETTSYRIDNVKLYEE